jgi:putative SOS response-associated peptidase YedK
MFRQAFRKRRCLVPADGFYEWKGVKPAKQPSFIHMKDDRIFTMAGLWERWQPPDGPPLDTFTILTTKPNTLLAPIHNRMPVIVAEEDRDKWLLDDDAKKILRPYNAAAMETFPVSSKINNPKMNPRT